MATIKKFEDLECWQEARKLVNMVYKAVNGMKTKSFKRNSVYPVK